MPNYLNKIVNKIAFIVNSFKRSNIDNGSNVNISSRNDQTDIRLQGNLERLNRLKDIHKGHRAFIIGSGPSLRVSDLDRLKDEITFACNKIYLAYDQTDWRPTYYSVIDTMVAKNNFTEIEAIKETKLFNKCVYPTFQDSKDIIWINDLPPVYENDRRIFKFSKDLSKGTYGGFTVLYSILQAAFWMGIREVYILGLDYSFSTPQSTMNEKSPIGETLLKSEGELNHFHKDYRKPGEVWTYPRLDYQYEAFQAAKKAFEEEGGIIYNASRQTKLDVFPLISFDKIA